MINKDLLNKMKKKSMLINLSRGELANDNDLLNHVENNPDFYYGADTFTNEPVSKKVEFKHKLFKHERILKTCHIGASTNEA